MGKNKKITKKVKEEAILRLHAKKQKQEQKYIAAAFAFSEKASEDSLNDLFFAELELDETINDLNTFAYVLNKNR